MMNLGNSLLMNSEKYPRKPAVVVDGEERTYGELNSRVNRLANGLMSIGLKKGDLIGILSYNSVAWIESLYAIFKMGAVAVPINFRLSDKEMLEELKRTGVSALFLADEYLPVVTEYQAVCGRYVPVILLREGRANGTLFIEKLISGASDDDPDVGVNGEDVAAVLFTGGTTGLPKGALCTHRMLTWTTINCMTAYETPRTDHIMLHPFPLFHGSGIFRVISYISAGATYLTVKSFDAETCLRLIEKYAVTSFIGSSAIFLPMHEFKSKNPVNTASVTNCIATFAFMDREGRKRLTELFPNAAVYEGYGSTEGGPICALAPNQEPKEQGSVGRPSVYTRIKIVDDQGNPLPPGETGEIVVKGPHVATGYYNNREETEAAFKDGWFHTGDMGKLDDDGFLYMVDRKKDMIKTGGENVYSREVEEVLLRHPAVEDAAVIGVPHARWGETIKAVVVEKKGMGIKEQELIDFCRTQMASYKKPTAVVFVASIPKTETGGKVSKWMLREKYG
jgi:acyl-CoA synthetase (AMP-forming)/AMP-acid ligase II